MAKKTSKTQTATKKAIAEFGAKVTDLKERGFEPLIPIAGVGEGLAPATPVAPVHVSAPRVTQLTNDVDVPYVAADDSHVGGSRMAAGFSFFAGRQSQPEEVVSRISLPSWMTAHRPG